MSVSLRPSSPPLLASWQGRSRSGRRVKAGTWSAQECPRVSVVVVWTPPKWTRRRSVRPSVWYCGSGECGRPWDKLQRYANWQREKPNRNTQTSGVTRCETEYELVWPFKRRCREKEKNDAELDSSNIRPTWWRKKSRACGSGDRNCDVERWRLKWVDWNWAFLEPVAATWTFLCRE